MISTFNRGKLFRLAQQGKLVMVEGYSFDDCTGAERTNKELPVQVIENNDQWKDGFCNVRAFEFKSKSGCAYVSGTSHTTGETLVTLIVHSNHNVTFRIKK